MKIISSKNVVHIIRRTLNCVDERLIGHGERVAYIVYKMLELEAKLNEKEKIDLCITALLHDIGAYKTEDINYMVEFESKNIWRHSVYGYLFLKKLSPLKQYAQAVLYHHLSDNEYDKINIEKKMWHYTQMIHLADRIDLIFQNKDAQYCTSYIKKKSGTLFSAEVVKLFFCAEEKYHIFEKLKNNDYYAEFDTITEAASFTMEEKKHFLEMIAYSIDFRSEFMVLHTVTTVSVSQIAAQILALKETEKEKIYFGALLHDVGKVACPVGILEKGGKLTHDEMEIMKHHVVVTGEVLQDYINDEVKKIAVRHHEKLDGSGYPKGLKAEDLSQNERIVAVADIVSALVRKRSYKGAYDNKTTISILENMKQGNKICPYVTETVICHFEQILEQSQWYGKEISELYESIQQEYEITLKQFEMLFA